MQPVAVNVLAVVVSAVITMIIGFVWYGSMLFGKEWMKLSGINEAKIDDAKKKGMTKTYAVSFVGTLLMAYVLAHILAYAQAQSMVAGMQAGFWSWLGFVAPVQLTSVLFDGKPFKLYAINTGYYLVSLLIMGAILAVWV